MQVIYFLSMPFDLDCVLEYLWNWKPEYKDTYPRSSLHLLNQDLQSWSSNTDLFEVPQETSPSTYVCWEYKLVQSLNINLAAVSLLGIFSIIFYNFFLTMHRETVSV